MLNSDDFRQKYIFNGTFSKSTTRSLSLRDTFYSLPIVYLFLWVLIVSWIYQFARHYAIFHFLCRCALFTNAILVAISTIYNAMKGIDRTSSEEKLEQSHKSSMVENKMMEEPRPTLASKFLSTYCVHSNSKIITTTDLGSDSIQCIHGMR